MQWGNTPGGRTTYRQIGPMTYGSDGSHAYSTGEGGVTGGGVTYQRSGNFITYSNGNRAVIDGNVYTEYDRNGGRVRSYVQVDGAVSCTP